MAEGGGDSGPTSGRSSAAPGRAPPLPSSARRVAAAPTSQVGPPAPVDFDALSAALGRTPTSSPRLESNDSSGRLTASYASSRPHPVAPSRMSAEADPNMPAVIVSVDDTVPSAPPRNMTTPLAGAVGVPQTVPLGVGHSMAHPPHVTPSHPPPPSQPMAHAPGMHHVPAPPPSQPSHPFTPQPFAVQAVAAPPRHVAHPTIRMPDAPRRPRSPTVVLREQGPSTAQKLGAFMAMLVLFTACGIAVIVWQRPSWLGLAPPPAVAPVATAATNPVAVPPPTVATPAALPVTTTTATASPAAAPSAARRAASPTKAP